MFDREDDSEAPPVDSAKISGSATASSRSVHMELAGLWLNMPGRAEKVRAGN